VWPSVWLQGHRYFKRVVRSTSVAVRYAAFTQLSQFGFGENQQLAQHLLAILAEQRGLKILVQLWIGRTFQWKAEDRNLAQYRIMYLVCHNAIQAAHS
jgi:hypothetical protein